MINKLGYRGYATHNQFGDYKIPVPALNIIYKDYVNKNNLLFKLSVNEINVEGCYLTMMALLKELHEIKGVIMYSFLMLPPQKKVRKMIFDAFLKTNTELHFILENLIIKNQKDDYNLEELFTIKFLTQKCLKLDELNKMMEN